MNFIDKITGKDKKDREVKIQEMVKNNVELYKRVFSGPDGKAVLEDLRKRCFVDRTTYHENPVKMGMNEGRRSIFVHIQNMVEKDIESILADLKGVTHA